MSPPPAIAEFIANCEFIRPVFDIDMWDEGDYSDDPASYRALRQRISWQLYCIFKFFRQLFPSHHDEIARLSHTSDAIPMDESFQWKTLDMAVLESPCKRMTKQFGKDTVHGIKHSFHLRFPMMRIDSVLMIGIFPYLIKYLEDTCPRNQDLSGAPLSTLSNNWFDALDSRILQAGIKMPGSQKAQKCQECFRLVVEEQKREREATARRFVANAATVNILQGKGTKRIREDPVFEDTSPQDLKNPP
jgi:hypothetical protein